MSIPLSETLEILAKNKAYILECKEPLKLKWETRTQDKVTKTYLKIGKIDFIVLFRSFMTGEWLIHNLLIDRHFIIDDPEKSTNNLDTVKQICEEMAQNTLQSLYNEYKFTL